MGIPRRSFLKLIGFAGSVAILPATALSIVSKPKDVILDLLKFSEGYRRRCRLGKFETLQICKDRMTFNYWPIKGLTPHLRIIDQFSSDIEQMMIREETSFFPYLHPEMKTVFRSIIEDRNEVMKKEYDYVSWPHYSTDSLKLDLVIYNRSLTSIPDEDLTACGREMRKNEKEHVECIKKVLESRGVTC